MKKYQIIFCSIALLSILSVGCDQTVTSSSDNQNTSLQPISVIADQRPVINPNCEAQEVVDGWIPTWCEEFSYSGKVDESIWNYQTGSGGWGNNELQYYTRGDNVDVKDGVLTITAKKQSYQGSGYTSSRINTANKFDFKYGRIDIRAKLPRTRGTWPAIWMMPTKGVYGSWPKSGEIDIMEHSASYNLNSYMGSIHTEAYNHKINTQKGSGYIPYNRIDKEATTLVDDFHVYSIVWDKDSLAFLFDNHQYYKINTNELYKPSLKPYQAWPFDQNFHLILNVAVGGSMGGNVDSNFTSDSMQVDYIRYFQKDYTDLDIKEPTHVSNIKTVSSSLTQISTNLTWDKPEDFDKIKQYHIFVNGVKKATCDNNMYLLEGLSAAKNYTVSIIAQNYNGKVSEPSHFTFITLSWPKENEAIDATKYYVTQNKNMVLKTSSDVGGGYTLGNLTKDDIFRYKVMLSKNGKYQIEYRVNSYSSNSNIEFMYDTLTLQTSLGSTNSSWKTITSTPITLPSGEHIITIKVKNEGFDINWFRIVFVE